MLKCNSEFDLKNSKKYIPSEVAKIRFCQLPDGSYKYESDVCLIFNQLRIANQLGVGTANTFIDKINAAYKAANVKRPDMTDEQLLKFVKDRNIQTPSEMLAWTEYLMSETQKVADDYKQSVDTAVQKELARQAKEKADFDARIQQGVQNVVNASK